jgi:Ribonuclease P 40kDa (Rpp40) subunit
MSRLLSVAKTTTKMLENAETNTECSVTYRFPVSLVQELCESENLSKKGEKDEEYLNFVYDRRGLIHEILEWVGVLVHEIPPPDNSFASTLTLESHPNHIYRKHVSGFLQPSDLRNVIAQTRNQVNNQTENAWTVVTVMRSDETFVKTNPFQRINSVWIFQKNELKVLECSFLTVE